MLMLAGIVVLHITTIILLLVATIDNAWVINDSMSAGLWGKWELKTSSVWHYTNLKDYPQEYLQTVQATSVLACIFAILALFVFVAQLFTLPKGQRFTFTGVLQLIACLCIMIAASIYTAELQIKEQGGYGHSYVLAWISFVFTLLLAVTYLILRKKSE
ncbi:peripheral myelin protein 22-like [Seriola lalandi dorsalis]|uniref:Epithelial membrane protein 1 n=2 Tax=Seriola TaxID=8160 RepID=A0A3B4TI36_SERDU|nr:peripheral myelin protein 22-like [Seriola dumerili]XP_022614355.1 peripheral myelin protein 22-like [Seriola dumerili]XP_023274935.1 peripheral myelin protein 22-like [Seriola lalandi dorsalis]XP_056228010.1 epithelial membrane protein 1 [Seriola aureovittata]